MNKYDLRVLEVFKKLAGKSYSEALATAEKLEEVNGLRPERALAEALFHYGLGGAVKRKVNEK